MGAGVLRSTVGMTQVLKWTCDGLRGLWVFKGFGWNIKVVSIVICAFVRRTVSRCLTFPALQEVAWSRGQVSRGQVLANSRSRYINTRSFPPVPAFGSIWVVLWLLFFRSAPSTFPQRRGYLLGACFRESLVIRLHSEIGQIHFSIEAQCDSTI